MLGARGPFSQPLFRIVGEGEEGKREAKGETGEKGEHCNSAFPESELCLPPPPPRAFIRVPRISLEQASTETDSERLPLLTVLAERCSDARREQPRIPRPMTGHPERPHEQTLAETRSAAMVTQPSGRTATDGPHAELRLHCPSRRELPWPRGKP